MSDQLLIAIQNIHTEIRKSGERIHGRIDDIAEKQALMSGTIQHVESQVSEILADRPCAEVRGAVRDIGNHIEVHKRNWRQFAKQLVQIAVSVTATIAALWLAVKWGLG
jgi:DNA-binding ferritin-like protein